ncbi:MULTISPECIES: hypothetical protein [unclassified Caulobacter]|uniref:hypothetical protein n=1 Tax=unclassified Caulobacter TaxID=2648921 RepID=UPI000D3B5A90|nr:MULTISPECIES: hypothetical protein [unclassified Caulobacter]PTS87809.1 hypothetical protein DBR21_11570 [Caulobacter sp. HMWF009]PTT10622.1 hypothetical protein DBR10_04920 [Caulobacter sp. HMWF025]
MLSLLQRLDASTRAAVIIALVSLAVDITKASYLVRLSARQGFVIGSLVALFWLLIWGVSLARRRPLRPTTALVTAAVCFWPVIRDLLFNACFITGRCIF